ncbi:MAG: hypothetical protein Q4A31_08150 [Corynebacterium sp.]|uniref:hypothetical protein n=1 Tax=Corynebacterium sp. TaxID=1720 RepID=UPI0026DD4CAC|nr:hypothetical protein [Corynebacterium sp.]MDO4761872.1 hypothetical protein [Corynebacterium sp.]
MSRYQHNPPTKIGEWLKIFSFFLILLALPALLLLIAPDWTPRSTVILGSEKDNWSTPLIDANNTPQECTENVALTLSNSWDCNGNEISSGVVAAGTIKERTITRALKGYGQTPGFGDIPVTHEGNVYRASDPTGIFGGQALMLFGKGDMSDQAILVIINGPDAQELGDTIFDQLKELEREGI